MSLVLYALAALAFLVYKLATAKREYFEKKGIPYAKPTFLFGSRSDMILRHKTPTELVMNLYNEFPDEKLSGFYEFSRPTFLVRDPRLIKRLAVKEFDSFPDHRAFLDENADPLFGRALFSLTGNKWRDMRATLSPAFTGSKMRQMFELVSVVGQQVAKTLEERIKQGGEVTYEFKNFARKFTVDVIATCAFGIEVNSFENEDNDFHRVAAKVANFGSYLTSLKFAGFFMIPKVMKFFKIKLFDQETTDFFRTAIADTMRVRSEQGIVRHDMINLLIQAKKGNLSHEREKEEKSSDGFATVEESQIGRKQVTRKWTDDDLAAQGFIFFFAGFDTVSTVMSFMVYELVAKPDIHRRLQQEVDEVNKELDGKMMTYEKIQSMKYMDQVVCETLRYWAPAPMMDRICVKDFELEYDDKKFTIEKDKSFYIPIHAIHHDEQYYRNPDKFDPERFSVENRGNIDPDTYMPFGVGPRNCIGSRFALMEIKTIIYYLLLSFNLVATEKTQIPLKLAKNPTALVAEKGIWVGFKPRK